jgi:hypothetical protein
MKFDDDISHELQGRIDNVIDMLQEIIPDAKNPFKEWKKLGKVVSELANIRDNIPCTCGEEENEKLGIKELVDN